MKPIFRTILLISFFSASFFSFAETDRSNQQKNINTEIEDLKEEVLELNQDLLILEQELLFSANAQINVFLSMNKGRLFNLDSVQLKVDGSVISNYLYTRRGNKALSRGGIQKLYMGNLTPGEHTVTAVFTGQGENNKTVKRKTSKKINKINKPLFIELQIIDDQRKKQAEFSIKTWEL